MKQSMWFVLLFCMCSFALTACGPSERATTIDGLTGDVAKGKALYDVDCAGCHGVDGAGTSRGDSLLTDGVKGDEDASLADFIIDGDGAMPAYGDQYSDQDIADVVAHIRVLQK